MPPDLFDHLFIEPASFDASLAFYRDVLGWRTLYAWGDGGQPRGARLASAGMKVVLAEPHPAGDHASSHGIDGHRPTTPLRVGDIDRRYAEPAASGAALFAPEATHWGTRWFGARDPDGNRIAFEQAQA